MTTRERLLLGGVYYVSGTVLNAHRIYAVDPNGTAAGSFLQPVAQQQSPTGILYMTTDGTSLIGGSDQGISVFDTGGSSVSQIIAANGPQTIVNPDLLTYRPATQ